MSSNQYQQQSPNPERNLYNSICFGVYDLNAQGMAYIKQSLKDKSKLDRTIRPTPYTHISHFITR